MLAASILLLVSGVTGLIAAEGHNPENAANSSDAVIHGIVSDIADSGEVAEHHPVRIDVFDAFKGNRSELVGRNLPNTITVQVKGTKRMSVSTAAKFTEGEEVVVMLQERNDRFYMTTGYATKYEVQNGSIELLEPERRNITVEQMESIVENTTRANQTDIDSGSVTDREMEIPWTGSVTDFFEGIYNFFRNL